MATLPRPILLFDLAPILLAKRGAKESVGPDPTQELSCSPLKCRLCKLGRLGCDDGLLPFNILVFVFRKIGLSR
jgi:hypothetical protein